MPDNGSAESPATVHGRILAIDCLPVLTTAFERLGLSPLVHARHGHLDARLLAKVEPDLIVAPLLAPACDAMELCGLLYALDYRGRFAAISGPLPNVRTVEAELRAHCPDIMIEILIVEDLGSE